MNTYRQLALSLAAALAVFGAAGAAAEESLNANDLQPAKLAAPAVFDGFTINATPEKAVTIDAVSPALTAPDGEVFNFRIKLGGSGKAEYRSIKFPAKAGADVAVYLNSSSKTDARILKAVDGNGAVLAELTAPADTGAEAGYATFKAAADGDILVFSADSGINIYAIVVR